MRPAKNPISSWHLSTRDADEAATFLADHYVASLVRPVTPGQPMRVDARFLIGDNFFATDCRVIDGLVMEPLAELDMIVVYLSVEGVVRVETARQALAGTTDTIVVSSSRSVKRMTFSAGRHEYLIAVGADDVQRRLREFVGFDVYTAFDFLIAVDAGTPLGSALFSFGSLMRSALAGDTLLQSSPIGLRRHTDGFIDLALAAMGTDRIRDIAGPAQSASYGQVRRAEDFMRFCGHEPISIGDVANHVGVSVRALQYAFRQHRDTTPLAVLQAIRLQGFRDDLRKGSADPVAVTAARWGFTHLSRLARQYREAFGEKPSVTVMRARVTR